MGNNYRFNEKNPPSFDLNVNHDFSQGKLNNYYTQNILNINQPQNDIKNNTLHIKQEINKRDLNQNNKKEINKYIEENDLSIDIDIINKTKVNVKIPVNKNKIWQKEYNHNQFIGEIINDYINENKLNLSLDLFNELRCFKYRVSKEDKISTLLPIDDESEVTELQTSNNNNKTIDLSHIDEKYTEIMGKPFFSPFEILCFYKNERKFRILNYNDDLIEKIGINKYDNTSSYCNGWNHIYISGGVNCLTKLWDINLKKNLIHNPINIPPKKYHSMIFIPKHIVFIVGGTNYETFFYNLKEKRIINWGNLNSIRIEPALQIIKNKLYCITSITDKNNFTLEVTDLTSNGGKWSLIKPKLSYNIINSHFFQQIFGICKNKEDNIIFLGGQINDNNNEKNKNYMNFMYNIVGNSIELSQVKYKKFKLKEKGFCPFNNIYDFILTDFPRESPQMAFYNKNKGKVELINFSPNDILPKIISGDDKNQNQKKINIKSDLDNISSIPPNGFKENNLNINTKINNIDLNKETCIFFDKQNMVKPKDNLEYCKKENIKNNNISKINYYKNNNIINNNNFNNNNINNLNNYNNNRITNLKYQNNYIKKENPFFLYNLNPNINQINKNYLFYKQVPIVNNRNTVGTISLTPNKYYNNLSQLYATNNYANYRQTNLPHSFDCAQKKYYLPRNNIKNYNKNNRNHMKNYY